jgi:hypothetical protein
MSRQGSRGRSNRGGGGFGRSNRGDMNLDEYSSYVLID